MKTNETEIRELMRKALQGLIDKNDLTGTEKGHILHFAKLDLAKGMKLVNDLMLANLNPDADPEKEIAFWVNRLPDIKDAQKLIEWLSPKEPGILSKKLILDGAKPLSDEIQTYLNAWQSHTKEGLDLKSRQTRETITSLERIILENNQLDFLSINELDKAKHCIRHFENLSKQISILLEKYNSDSFKQPAKPVSKKTEAVTFRWTQQPEKQLPKLYRKLIDGGFIASETSLETFTACFTGQPVHSITEKIKWQKSKALLAYFIDSIKNPIAIADWWKITDLCFENGTGLLNNRNQYSNNNDNLPKGYYLIDEVLSDLK